MSIESSQEILGAKTRVGKILTGEIMTDSQEMYQVKLAYELYLRLKPGEVLDPDNTEDQNKAGFLWVDGKDSSYSKAYRKLISDPKFRDHQRLDGDFRNITVDDVVYYKEHGQLPKE